MDNDEWHHSYYEVIEFHVQRVTAAAAASYLLYDETHKQRICIQECTLKFKSKLNYYAVNIDI